jgi:hypothetical protein
MDYGVVGASITGRVDFRGRVWEVSPKEVIVLYLKRSLT